MQGQPRIKQLAFITITGPNQCGKSIVADRIRKVLEEEFGPIVFSQEIDLEGRANSYSKLDECQQKMVSETLWIIEER